MIEREVVGIFGKMNAGKSSVMNLLTQQESSIVDPTPGTTADTRVALMELHGLGPVRLLDTAGYDESDRLGGKKRKKVLEALKECDLILLVVDPQTDSYTTEEELIGEAIENDKQLLVVYNLRPDSDASDVLRSRTLLPALGLFPHLVLDSPESHNRMLLLDWIASQFVSGKKIPELLPFVKPDNTYILVIPMDEETPPGRLLRPQALALEYITRKWAFPICYRLNLKAARSGDPSEAERWNSFISGFKTPPHALITDSQAMDIMKSWCPPHLLMTTFSVMMINYMSRGRLLEFADAVRVIDSLQPGDRVVIAEACNHSRIQEDIGTVQIPSWFAKNRPGVVVHHLFGRNLPDEEDLKSCKLIIHCGGCMITPQKMSARLRLLSNRAIPVTNYGLFLSYIQGSNVLGEVLKVWEME